MKVWETFEKIKTQGGILNIGLSNCYDLALLKDIYSR
jgi:diketogulonate reductase-like aldo/keto reductase